MISLPRFTLLLLLLALAACSTLSKSELAGIHERHVSQAVVAKLEKGDPLKPADIIELTLRKAPQEQIVKYVKKTGVHSPLSQGEAEEMRRAGVSAQVIDLLAKESEKFTEDYAATHGEPYRAPLGLEEGMNRPIH